MFLTPLLDPRAALAEKLHFTRWKKPKPGGNRELFCICNSHVCRKHVTLREAHVITDWLRGLELLFLQIPLTIRVIILTPEGENGDILYKSFLFSTVPWFHWVYCWQSAVFHRMLTMMPCREVSKVSGTIFKGQKNLMIAALLVITFFLDLLCFKRGKMKKIEVKMRKSCCSLP